MKMMWLSLALAVGTISFNVLGGDEFDAGQIRLMVRQGQILSLDSILKKHPLLAAERMLDLEVESEHGRIIYEIEVLNKNGGVEEWQIDAESGELLKQEIEH